MPDIKHNFTGGKMNKDLDKRLVPNGQYRDAMNIQVSSSDGDNSGAVQNILGNTHGCPSNLAPQGSSAIGSISDEKNDTLYWFTASQEFPASETSFSSLIASLGDKLSDVITSLYDLTDPNNPLYTEDIFSFRDMILRKKGSTCTPVLVDTFGFIALSPSTTGLGNPTHLTNLPNEIYSLVDVGWNVTCVNVDGTHGATSNVINTLDAAFLNCDFGFDPGYQSYGGSFNPGKVQLPLGPVFAMPGMDQTFFLQTTKVLLAENNLSNTISGTPPVGASITIDGVTQSGTTILAKSLVDMENQFGLGFTAVLVTLSLPFDPAFVSNWVSPVSVPPDYNENFLVGNTSSGVVAVSAVDNNGDGLTGSASFSSLVANGTLNGDLIFGDAAFEVFDEILTAGVPVAIEPNAYYPNGGNLQISASSFNPLAYEVGLSGSITVQILDSSSGNVILPIADWGNDGYITIDSDVVGTIIFETPLDYYDYTENKVYDAMVFDASNERLLGFNKNNYITGINILDDMLFWTDGESEPKKINVPRSILGTESDGNKHTRLVNKALNYGMGASQIDIPIRREHITVIRKAPSSQLSVNIDTGRDPALYYTGVVYTDDSVAPNFSSIIGSSNSSTVSDFSSLEIGETVSLTIESNYENNANFALEWKEGDEVVLKEYTDPTSGKPDAPITNYTVKGVITDWEHNSFVSDFNAWDGTLSSGGVAPIAGKAQIMMEVLSVQGTPIQPDTGLHYFAIDRYDKEDKLFEAKFPRFSYRYKYEDGEYSTLAPFTQVVFKPGTFDYHAKKGYNLGMVNTINKITLGNFVADDMPKDVIEIDILYKEDGSPNIYVVDSLAPNDEPHVVTASGFSTPGGRGKKTHWELDKYEIENETVRGALASNQLVRLWDNVPKKALAQEVSGNRIIYGNYEQNFDLKKGQEKYRPQFLPSASSWNNTIDGLQNIKSVKSLREYQMGVVFTDKYGRETPVISNSSGVIKLNNEYSTTQNRLKVGFHSDQTAPDDAEYFKFYVKENSGEYYNLAMDRWYDAEDGNIWLAFPSTERNKITEDTYLILKTSQGIEDADSSSKYSVVAIENQAPDFIKTIKLGLGKRTHDPRIEVAGGESKNRLFGAEGDELLNAPKVGSAEFNINYPYNGFGNSTLSNLDEINDGVLYLRFEKGGDYSARYRVSELTSDRNSDGTSTTGMHPPTTYNIILEKALENNVNFIYDLASSPSEIISGVKITFWKYKTENKARYDGRFFVKIFNDGSIKKTITSANENTIYSPTVSRMIYLLQSEYMQGVHKSCAVTNDGINVLDNLTLQQADGNRKTWEHMNARTSFFSKLRSGIKVAGNGNKYHGFYDMEEGDVDQDPISSEETYNKIKSGKPWTPVSGMETDFKDVWFINKQLSRGRAYTNRLYLPNTKNWDQNPNNGTGIHHRGTHYEVSEYHGRTFSESYFGLNGSTYADGFVDPAATGTLPGMGMQSSGITHSNVHDKSHIDLGFGGIEAPGGKTKSENALALGSGTLQLNTGLNSIGRIKASNARHTQTQRFLDVRDWTSQTSVAGNALASAGGYTNLADPFTPGLSLISPSFGLGGLGTDAAIAINEFFNIGGEGSGQYPGETPFVKEISPGSQFKWVDDPYETNYSLNYGVKERQLHRFHQGDSGFLARIGLSKEDSFFMGSPANYTKIFRFGVAPKMNKWNPTANYGSEIENGLSLGIKTYDVAVVFPTNNGLSFTVTDTENIEPGMTVVGTSIEPNTIITSVSGLTVTISNNHTASAAATATLTYGFMCLVIEDLGAGVTANPEEYHVEVNSTVLECSIHGGRYSLKKGMLLKAYNVDANHVGDPTSADHTFPHTFDGDGVSVNESSNLLIKHIEPTTTNGVTTYKIRFTGFTQDFNNFFENGASTPADQSDFNDSTVAPVGFTEGTKLWFRQASMNSASNWSELNGDNSRDNLGTINGGVGAVGYELQFQEPIDVYEDGGFLPENPFVWETEQDEKSDLDIYYEASGLNPIKLSASNVATVFPIDSKVSSQNTSFTTIITGNISANGDEIFQTYDMDTLEGGLTSGVSPGDKLVVTRPDKTSVTVIVHDDWVYDSDNPYSIRIKENLFNGKYELNWFNCYSFGNGVESNRIRDSFNNPFIQNGVRVSTTLDEPYGKEHRKYGLIYSGIYNSTSGVNNLNQFSMAEKITKDVNPAYGSIQKLHSRSTADGDLIALCEDRILKILANKDALFNADGNPQLIATDRVLGEATPFSGEYGISKNPESFASHSYRVYFSDKVRGAVLRLSKDGLTPISNFGMKDWFRDKLQLSNVVVGSHDDKNQEYNITLKGNQDNHTVTFKENVKGWSSFKSFIPEYGISCANDYYTFSNAKLYKHNHEATGRNTFYGIHNFSTVSVIFNNAPSIVKSFKTINYEGSQSKVDENWGDNQYHNLSEQKGWFVDSIVTDKEKGDINEFIEKEGKWFNYIKGKNVKHTDASRVLWEDGKSTFDQASFAIQGLGLLNSAPILTSVGGCTDATAFNYDSNAIVDDGSCIAVELGCITTSSSNFSTTATTDDGSCLWYGCEDVMAFNYAGPFPAEAYTYYNSSIGTPAILATGFFACIPVILGCTDPTATGYDSSANTDDGSCISFIYGCMLNFADNFDILATADNGSCSFLGCWEPLDVNYGTTLTNTNLVTAENYNGYFDSNSGLQDDGILCISGGCTYGPSATEYYWDDIIVGGTYDGLTWGAAYNVPDPGTGLNFYPASPPLSGSYNSSALYEDGSCMFLQGCTDPLADNYYAGLNAIEDGSCQYIGCMDTAASNYNPIANVDDGSCDYDGCMDTAACNYNATATIDDGSCDYILCAGCMQGSFTNGTNTYYSNNLNLQTGTAINCMDPTNTTVIPCEIPCGNGSDATDNGDVCCNFVIYGCTDSAYCNFNVSANTDDGSCSNNTCTGCMESSWSLYNTNISTGLPQVNTLDCNGDLGGTNVSCCGTNFVNGCMDSNACNYDVNATTDPYNGEYSGANGGQTSCIYKIDSVSIVTGSNPGTNIPASTNMEIVNNIYFDPNDTSIQASSYLYFVPTGAGNAGNWPVGGATNTGAGNYQYYNQTSTPSVNVDNSIRLLIQKKNLFTNTWSDVLLSSDIRGPEIDASNQQNQLDYGFPFSNPLSVYADSPNGHVPAQYRYTVYSELWKSQYIDSSTGFNTNVLPATSGLYKFGGTPAGNQHTHYSPDCGVSNEFSYSIIPCDGSNSTMGCTDPIACNYDSSATCDDGSCYYGTTTLYGGPSCAVVDGCSGGYTTYSECCNNTPNACS